MVGASRFNFRRQILAITLRLPSVDYVQVVEAERQPRVTAIAELLQFTPSTRGDDDGRTSARSLCRAGWRCCRPRPRRSR